MPRKVHAPYDVTRTEESGYPVGPTTSLPTQESDVTPLRPCGPTGPDCTPNLPSGPPLLEIAAGTAALGAAWWAARRRRVREEAAAG